MEEESTMWKILNNTLSCAKIRIINSQFSWKKSKALMQKRENERKWDKKKTTYTREMYCYICEFVYKYSKFCKIFFKCYATLHYRGPPL